MQILFDLHNQNIQSYDSQQKSPSFKMKMSELKGIDQFVAKKYKLPIEKFKVLSDFQQYCKKTVDEISKKDFLGRRNETRIQRKSILQEWFDYTIKENDFYTSSMVLMILAGITAALKPKEDTLPPVLNKGVLANTISDIQDKLCQDENTQLNFEKEYKLNLQKILMSEENVLDESLNGWIVIKSQKHDAENFESNVNKLKMLSNVNWCTKSFKAKPYLSMGDFHIYMECGKPVLGVRFKNDIIEEIQGETNNSKIPVKYYDIISSYIKDFELGDDTVKEVETLNKAKAEADVIIKKFPDDINNYPPEEILESFGIKCKKDDDGMLIISHYGPTPNDVVTFSDFGVDEERLLKNIKIIEGNANFNTSKIKNIGNIEYIGGNANFSFTRIKDLGKLKEIRGNVNFTYSEILNLGDLASIGGNAYFSLSKITSLGNIKSVGGELSLGSAIESLGELEYIGGDVDFRNTKIKDLGKLKHIDGDAKFINSKITSLGNLEYIGEDAWFLDSKITDIGKLKTIRGNALFPQQSIFDELLANIEILGLERKHFYPLPKGLFPLM